MELAGIVKLIAIRNVRLSIAVFAYCLVERGPYDRVMAKAQLTWSVCPPLVVIVIILLTFPGSVEAQPSSRPHPRIWLDAATIQGIKSQASVAGGAVQRGAARCRAARETPSQYANGGWQGFEFVTTLSGCLLSWEATQSADDLATAIKYWN